MVDRMDRLNRAVAHPGCLEVTDEKRVVFVCDAHCAQLNKSHKLAYM